MAHCLPEARESIAVWLPWFRDLACVDRSWNACVLYIINIRSIRRKEFWNSTFEVDWLVEEWGGCLLLHPEVRLQRLLAEIRNADPLVRWWYNVQLHLHLFCQKYVQRHGTAPSYVELFDICYRQSGFNGRSCRELFPEVFLGLPQVPFDYPIDQPIDVALFHDLGFVKARDLGCPNLGCSIQEVLGTVLCMTYDDGMGYCYPGGQCGCAEPEIPHDSEP